MGLDIRVRRRSFQSPCSHANASLRMEHHRHYCCINLRPLGADVCPATQKENLVMEPDEIDLDDDLTADYDSSLDYQTDEKAYPASTKINANMHWAAALLFGTWYSIILGSAMSAGFKYLLIRHTLTVSFNRLLGPSVRVSLSPLPAAYPRRIDSQSVCLPRSFLHRFG